LHPVFAEFLETLAAAGALGVLMSGSGPTVFGLFENLSAARRAAGGIKHSGLWVWATDFT
jgi:4-diphosphocytidyl-2-C-methyl-D-erythritol kinase